MPDGQPQAALLRKIQKNASFNPPIQKAGLPCFISLFYNKHISLSIIKRYNVNFVKYIDC